ncbi:hypothetical protein [Sulfuricurvum sp.]|uniref:hypothetical protein n=1 Tax=Sulfuricurvum sp. TaxID=2025608 RepID=UPI002D560D46|nr:hypothetical protein [Sulfuricurvum sp.]HZF71261.1 hypothetical protein [Sulfuricurvum sp.]
MANDRDKRYQSALISDVARENAKNYKNEKQKIRRQIEDNFFKKSLDFRDFVFSPEGYEGIFVGIYIALVPYLMGLVVLFFIAEGSYEHFIEFNLTSYLILWAIGYEVCAALILIIIFFAWLKQISNRWEREQVRKKPTRTY